MLSEQSEPSNQRSILMQTLFRRTSFLFWQYPILWLSVVIADLAAFSLNQLQAKLTHAIIMSMVSRSVLGNVPEPLHYGHKTLEIAILTRPIVWGAHLVHISLYSAAMVSMALLIPSLLQKEKLSLRTLITLIRESSYRLLLFSLKMLIVIGIGAVLMALPLVAYFGSHGPRYISINAFSYCESALFFAAIAYLMSSAAVRLLRPEGSPVLTPAVTRQARISAALATVASVALSFLALQVEPNFQFRSSNSAGIFAFEIAASLIAALPYIPLFIAFAILAADKQLSAEIPDDSEWLESPPPSESIQSP
jgi:hypothetical protein